MFITFSLGGEAAMREFFCAFNFNIIIHYYYARARIVLEKYFNFFYSVYIKT